MIGKILTDEDGKKWEMVDRVDTYNVLGWAVVEKKPTPMPELKAGDRLNTSHFATYVTVSGVRDDGEVIHIWVNSELRSFSPKQVQILEVYRPNLETLTDELIWKRE